ncbi:MAG: aspartate aminotransferase family protein [Candidatus Omnitrophica bacterium]|nr:aspartate aminotransferase family protein [Candidatus Omnitrophota bacterium]
MKDSIIKKYYSEYLLNTYRRVGPVFIKGKGSWLWDSGGRKYLDFFPGWGVSILGHCHPRITKTISEQSKRLIHLPNNLYHQHQALLAREIVKNSFLSKVFFANSGAEAIEGAIKFSRLFGKGRYEIIVMKNSFHGRTFGALSATGQAKYKEPFKPLLPEFKEAIFGDFGDLKAKYTPNTVAVLMELIQGEGGINVAPLEYVKNIKKFCQENNLLFIVDEVQTGMGRTSKLFCYQHYGVFPDVFVLSKGLGGGFPISALVIKKEFADLFCPGHHASTFGGSPLATAVAIEVFKIIEEENILENTSKMSEYLFERLHNLAKKFSFIKEIRGKGLMVGVELDFDAFNVFLKCLNAGLIINATHQTVLRIMPALNIKEEELDKGLKILEKVFLKF